MALVSLKSGDQQLCLKWGGEMHCFLAPSTFPHCATQAPVPAGGGVGGDEYSLGMHGGQMH